MRGIGTDSRPADDKDATIREQRGVVRAPRLAHRAREREGACRWVVCLRCRARHRLAGCHAAGDQDTAVGESRCRMELLGLGHRACRAEHPCRGIEDLGGRHLRSRCVEVGARATGDQDPTVREQRRRVVVARRRQAAGRRHERAGRWVIQLADRWQHRHALGVHPPATDDQNAAIGQRRRSRALAILGFAPGLRPGAGTGIVDERPGAVRCAVRIHAGDEDAPIGQDRSRVDVAIVPGDRWQLTGPIEDAEDRDRPHEQARDTGDRQGTGEDEHQDEPDHGDPGHDRVRRRQGGRGPGSRVQCADPRPSLPDSAGRAERSLDGRQRHGLRSVGLEHRGEDGIEVVRRGHAGCPPSMADRSPAEMAARSARVA